MQKYVNSEFTGQNVIHPVISLTNIMYQMSYKRRMYDLEKRMDIDTTTPVTTFLKPLSSLHRERNKESSPFTWLGFEPYASG